MPLGWSFLKGTHVLLPSSKFSEGAHAPGPTNLPSSLVLHNLPSPVVLPSPLVLVWGVYVRGDVGFLCIFFLQTHSLSF